MSQMLAPGSRARQCRFLYFIHARLLSQEALTTMATYSRGMGRRDDRGLVPSSHRKASTVVSTYVSGCPSAHWWFLCLEEFISKGSDIGKRLVLSSARVLHLFCRQVTAPPPSQSSASCQDGPKALHVVMETLSHCPFLVVDKWTSLFRAAAR